MSLIKSHPISEKQLAANRRNSRLSQGPKTAAGRARIRAAHLRHGFYAKAEEIALRSLGEDPVQFQRLLGELWAEFRPVGSFQEGLVIRLSRAFWLMNRADRMQDGCALRLAHDAGLGRDNRLHAQMMRLRMTADSLRLLVRSVARDHYVTHRDDLELMKKLQQQGSARDMGEIALALFYQLQAPGADEDCVDEREKARKVVADIKMIFGIGESTFSNNGPAQDPPEAGSAPEEKEEQNDANVPEAVKRYPSISPAEWEARDRARQLLQNILARQVEECEAQRTALIRETVAGPSP